MDEENEETTEQTPPEAESTISETTGTGETIEFSEPTGTEYEVGGKTNFVAEI